MNQCPVPQMRRHSETDVAPSVGTRRFPLGFAPPSRLNSGGRYAPSSGLEGRATRPPRCVNPLLGRNTKSAVTPAERTVSAVPWLAGAPAPHRGLIGPVRPLKGMSQSPPVLLRNAGWSRYHARKAEIQVRSPSGGSAPKPAARPRSPPGLLPPLGLRARARAPASQHLALGGWRR